MAATAGWHGGAVLVLGAAGLMVAAGVSLGETTDVSASRGADLPQLVDTQTERVARLEAESTDLVAQVEVLGRASDDDPMSAVRDDVADESASAGFSEVEGPGVTVSLDDAPVPEDLEDLPAETSADDFVVHQQDVEAVVNALWTGGAEAMQIMDRRITSVSAVRCVGNVIVLDGQVYSPPFIITAIGSPERLTDALDRSSGVQVYRQWADYIGLGYAVQEHESTTLPAATGPATLSHAESGTEPA